MAARKRPAQGERRKPTQPAPGHDAFGRSGDLEDDRPGDDTEPADSSDRIDAAARQRRNRELNVGLAERDFTPQHPDDISARDCCQCPCEALGREFARLLAQPESHQLGVCAALGLNYRKHMRWLAAEEIADYPELGKYQSIVLQAIDQQRRGDLRGMQRRLNQQNGMKAATQFNLDKFSHENRFRRFYGDEERKRVELSGPDGEPLPSTQLQYVVSIPEEEPDDEPQQPQGPTN